MASEPRRWLSLLCLSLALIGTTGTSSAESAAERETARALMREGDAAQDRLDHAAALEAYGAAHAIMQVPTTGIAVAQAQADLGHLVEARDMALAVMRMPVRPDEPNAFSEARAEASELAAALAPRIPSLAITVEGAPQDRSQVSVDGVPLARALIGVPHRINPGKHVISAAAPGFAEARAEIELPESTARTLSLRLEPSPDSGAVSASPVAPSPDSSPAAGQGAKRKLSPLVYVGFGVGAAGVALGSVAGIVSMSKTSSLEDRCPGGDCPESAGGDLDAANTWANLSNAGFFVGVIGLGVGVYGVLSSKGARPTELTRTGSVEPIAGTRFVGLRGRF